MFYRPPSSGAVFIRLRLDGFGVGYKPVDSGFGHASLFGCLGGEALGPDWWLSIPNFVWRIMRHWNFGLPLFPKLFTPPQMVPLFVGGQFRPHQVFVNLPNFAVGLIRTWIAVGAGLKRSSLII